jgi:hypothetical protein
VNRWERSRPNALEEGSQASPRSQGESRDIEEDVERARRRLLNAAIAFCDGTISAGQLRAVRELLREKEARTAEIQGKHMPPFASEPEGLGSPVDPEIKPIGDLEEPPDTKELSPLDTRDEMGDLLASLERKLVSLEQDYQQGRINTSQYRAIRRHYLEQREVARKLRQTHPQSDRWRVVLEEGKTTFLMQLHEAAVQYVALHDIRSLERLFEQGERPALAPEAVKLMGSFGGPRHAARSRMLAAHAHDGSTILLVPGRYTAAMISFSQDPPAWQIRALREVHRNFEAANRAALGRGNLSALVFPDLDRFFKSPH